MAAEPGNPASAPRAAPKRVLFLCTGNSARSQMAEALLRHLGGDRFDVVSAGTSPRPSVHPEALGTLERHRVSVTGLHPKDISRFAGESFDYVITVCDRAQEQCPVFPGAETIHWSFPDPVETTGADAQRRAFEAVFHGLGQRMRLLMIVHERAS